MRNKINILVIALFLFFIFIPKASASFADYRIVFDNSYNINYLDGSETSGDCNGIFTQDALDLISEILNWFRILAPVILIVLVGVDFGSAVLSQDNDAIKKATGKAVKRAIAVVALFFIPTIIRALINLPGVRDAIQIPNDPLCGTMKSTIVESEVLFK